MSKHEVLITLAGLSKAVDVADKAGIDPSHVVAPHCAETAAIHDDGESPSSDNLKWCGVSVIIDDDTNELFELSKPDGDPEQKPAFLVSHQPQKFSATGFREVPAFSGAPVPFRRQAIDG